MAQTLEPLGLRCSFMNRFVLVEFAQYFTSAELFLRVQNNRDLGCQTSHPWKTKILSKFLPMAKASSEFWSRKPILFFSKSNFWKGRYSWEDVWLEVGSWKLDQLGNSSNANLSTWDLIWFVLEQSYNCAILVVKIYMGFIRGLKFIWFIDVV